jgi:hypothetical protein
MSFVLERRIHADALVRIARLRESSPSTGDPVSGAADSSSS